MKQNLLFLVALLLVVPIFSQTCNCPKNNLYDEDENHCIPYPSQSDPGFIEGCLQYEHNKIGQWNCIKCQPQYLLSEIGTRCSYSGIDYCTYVSGEINYKLFSVLDKLSQQFMTRNLGSQNYQCEECQEGYYLAHNHCYQYPQDQDSVGYIQNCSTYHFNKQSNQLVCSKCDNLYYLKNELCFKAPQQYEGCTNLQHQQQGQQEIFKCLKCDQDQGYTLEYDNNGTCTKISDIFPHCKIGVESQCYTCDQGYFWDWSSCELNPSQNNYQYIENCEIYYHDIYSGSPFLSCKKCKNGYLANYDRQCISPQHVNNCQEYIYNSQIRSTECKLCESGYNLNNDKQCQRCPRN